MLFLKDFFGFFSSLGLCLTLIVIYNKKWIEDLFEENIIYQTVSSGDFQHLISRALEMEKSALKEAITEHNCAIIQQLILKNRGDLVIALLEIVPEVTQKIANDTYWMGFKHDVWYQAIQHDDHKLLQYFYSAVDNKRNFLLFKNLFGQVYHLNEALTYCSNKSFAFFLAEMKTHQIQKAHNIISLSGKIFHYRRAVKKYSSQESQAKSLPDWDKKRIMIQKAIIDWAREADDLTLIQAYQQLFYESICYARSYPESIDIIHSLFLSLKKEKDSFRNSFIFGDKIYQNSIFWTNSDFLSLFLKHASLEQRRAMLLFNNFQAFEQSAAMNYQSTAFMIIEEARQHGLLRDMLTAHSFDVTFKDGWFTSPELSEKIKKIYEEISNCKAINRYDLQYVARNQESSMQALAPQEDMLLNELTAHYRPVIASKGFSAIIQDLCRLLEKRYHHNPAKTENGTLLPYAWDDLLQMFKRGDLKQEDRTQVLQQYYKHPVHTAARLFMRENWGTSQAQAAQYAPLAPQRVRGWGQIEHAVAPGIMTMIEQDTAAQLPLEKICVCYLAAADFNVPAVDGYSIESRIDFFINELALINRAHNWDKTRFNHHTQKIEYYDDLEADKPSCLNGFTSRLYQSVQGHPFFKFLKTQDLDAEMRDFIREFWENQMTKQNIESLEKAWQAIIDLECSEQDRDVLKILSIPVEEQNVFMESMHQKYQQQFEKDRKRFEMHIRKHFYCHDNNSSHAEKFGGEYDLSGLLLQKKKDFTSQSAKAPALLFQQSPVQTQHKPYAPK